MKNSRASPGVSLRVYCISRVFRYTIIDFYLCIAILSSSFCLFLRSVSMVEHCALQERLKEVTELKEVLVTLPYLLIKFIDNEMKF